MNVKSLLPTILGLQLAGAVAVAAEPPPTANPIYTTITAARARGDTRALIRALPQVEALWPAAPQAYFQCLKQAAGFLVFGPATRRGAPWDPPPPEPLPTEIPLRNPDTAREVASALGVLFDHVMQKEWPGVGDDAITCLELKRDIVAVCCNVEPVRTDKSRLMALARFVGEIRSRIDPAYVCEAPELARAAQEILRQAGVPDRSALTNATLAQQYDRLMQESIRDSATNRLQAALREDDRLLTLSLLTSCAILPPADRQDAKFLGEVATAAKLAKSDWYELGLDPKPLPGAPALPARTEYGIHNYNRTAARCTNIIAQIAPPAQVGAAIQAVLEQGPLRGEARPDWPELRSKAAALVLTNLALLEAGLHLAAATTNVSPQPPWHKLTALQFVRRGETNRDPEVVAYLAAVGASRQLQSLTRALDDTRSSYWDRAIDAIASAYSRPPPADQEIRSLLTTYAGFDCAVQLSNRLYHTRPQRTH
jgi:hypothetical protein